MTIVLGIESTAHTFGIGIIKEGKILVNLKKSYSTEDGEGGMIPNEVAKHHASVKYEIYENALNEGIIPFLMIIGSPSGVSNVITVLKES